MWWCVFAAGACAYLLKNSASSTKLVNSLFVSESTIPSMADTSSAFISPMSLVDALRKSLAPCPPDFEILPVGGLIEICGLFRYELTLPLVTSMTSPSSNERYTWFTSVSLLPPQYLSSISPVLSEIFSTNEYPFLYVRGASFFATPKWESTRSPSLSSSTNCFFMMWLDLPDLFYYRFACVGACPARPGAGACPGKAEWVHPDPWNANKSPYATPNSCPKVTGV